MEEPEWRTQDQSNKAVAYPYIYAIIHFDF